MTNQAIEARIYARVIAMQQQRETQLKAFITIGFGELAKAVKHDIKQLIERNEQLEQRIQKLEERLLMVAGAGNNFPQ